MTDPPSDFFIAHASEDKADIARPLADELAARGFLVWYDEFELKVGESLTEQVDEGLRRCRFGVVVLTPDFFRKQWPRRELDGLLTREIGEERKVVLPIWHNVSAAEVADYSIVLADRVAVVSSKGIQYMADEVIRGAGLTVQPSPSARPEAARTRTSVKDLLESVFDGSGFAFTAGEYRSVDYDFVSLRGADEEQADVEIFWDVIREGWRDEPLGGAFWDDFARHMEEIPAPFALLISERSVGFADADVVDGSGGRMKSKKTYSPFVGVDEVFVIVLDFSGDLGMEEKEALLRLARTQFEQRLHGG